MKPMHLMVMSLALAAAIVLIIGLTEKTGPPPAVNPIYDGPASSPCLSSAKGEFYTGFDVPENPLSENGSWVNGELAGIRWSNVQTASGRAFGSRHVAPKGSGRYSDSISHVSASFRIFDANQFAQGTVHRTHEYWNPRGGHEIELLLRFRITPDEARGYEVLWGQDGGLAIVRWNGPLGDYTPLYESGPGFQVSSDGDVLCAQIGDDDKVLVYINGELKIVGPEDSAFTDGQPGIGFWPTPGSTLAGYGWNDFRAGDL